MSGYYNLDLNPDTKPFGLRHELNAQYKGAQRFELAAPDAAGTMIVWARDLNEARDHLTNALYELIFAAGRNGEGAHNPQCPFCDGRTQRRGRNSNGTRIWKCQGECKRSFVLDRQWRGGIGHAAQSKKPAFVRLLLSGVSVRDAADQLRLNISTAGNWAEKVAANNPEMIEGLTCVCGKPIRHRGSCWYRMGLTQKAAKLTVARASGGVS